MKTRIALFLILPALLLAQSKGDRQPKSLVLTHVTVIDVTGGVTKPDLTVVITGDRISQVEEAGKVVAAPGATVVDAAGKFLIPGLWDMHVHWYFRDTFTLFIANGVTGVRQMFGNSDLLRWRQDIAKGSLLGPRMIVASPIIDGPRPFWPNSIAVSNEDEGRKAVRDVKKWGADFVKVYSLLPREVYFAIADEAKRQGISFAGHVPNSVSPAEASDAGQKSVEHLTGMRARAEARAIETYDEGKAAELFARFVKNETWQCPTLTVLRGKAFFGDENFMRDQRLKFIPPRIKERWSQRIANRNEGNFANAKKVFQKELEIVGAMRKAGVQLLAGTDTGNPFCFPGFSIHDELALLVIAGLTPAEALRSATLNPAKFLGLDKTLGTIEQGKIADMVLLDANPLEEVRNTQRIIAVISNGRLFDRKALNKMLDQAEAAAIRP
jgi:imidazolonepropionase-like amidohydrolase